MQITDHNDIEIESDYFLIKAWLDLSISPPIKNVMKE